MTPEERAVALSAKIWDRGGATDAELRIMADAFRAAVREERERLVKRFEYFDRLCAPDRAPWVVMFVAHDRKPTEEDIRRGQEIAREHGWTA